MNLNRIALKLFCNPVIIRTFRFSAESTVKFLPQKLYFSSKVQEAISPHDKISSVNNAVPSELHSIKVVKRNEVTCDDLIKLLNDQKELLLIDVRDKVDIEKYGLIPSSIHIPLNKVKSSFQLSNDEFKAAFGKEKPDLLSENVIFYGLKELKSTSACEIAYSLGYKKVKSFPGGFKEWTEKGLEIFKVNSDLCGTVLRKEHSE